MVDRKKRGRDRQLSEQHRDESYLRAFARKSAQLRSSNSWENRRAFRPQSRRKREGIARAERDLRRTRAALLRAN